MVLDSIKQGIGPLSGIGGMYPAYYWLITTFSCLGARPKVLPTTIIFTINPLPAPSRSPDADCYQSSSPSRSPQLPMKNLKFSTGAISLKLHVTIVWRKIWMLLEGLLTDWPTGVNTRRCCHISIISKDQRYWKLWKYFGSKDALVVGSHGRHLRYDPVEVNWEMMGGSWRLIY